MRLKLVQFFIYTAGILLLVTALAKLISSSGTAEVLEVFDPIFRMPFRHVFWIVGTLELIIAIICFSGASINVKLGLVVWLSTSFMIYRICLWAIDYKKPCRCLGTFADVFHLSQDTVNLFMKIALVYLFIGSGIALLLLRRSKANLSIVNTLKS